jgi:hypothetical protein
MSRFVHCSTFVSQLTEALWLELFRQATILCTLKSLPPNLEAAQNLKFIHFISAGTDHISDNPMYTDTDIPLTTSSGIHGPMISEWVILQILSASHKQKTLLEWQNQHVWGNMLKLGPRKDAVGMRFGVLGYGGIGRQGMLHLPILYNRRIIYQPRHSGPRLQSNGYGCNRIHSIPPPYAREQKGRRLHRPRHRRQRRHHPQRLVQRHRHRLTAQLPVPRHRRSTSFCSLNQIHDAFPRRPRVRDLGIQAQRFHPEHFPR